MEQELFNLNEKNIVIRKWDKIYCNLLDKILKEGELFSNRTGIDTLSIEGVNFKINVGECFPILESKKVVLKNGLSEMLWIYQAQSNDVRWLEERNNPIWNEWKIDEDGIYRTYDNGEYNPDKKLLVYDIDGNILKDKYGKEVYTEGLIEGKNITSAKYFGKEYANTIGTAYGYINNKFKRPQYVLNQLKNNPHDRRMLISLWQDEYLKTAVLPSCVWSNEWKVKDGKLHCFVHQRSADVPLGLPFNVSQYAILQSMFAKVSGLEVGNLNWSIMDAHIYVNQLEGIKKQLERYKFMEECVQKTNSVGTDDLVNYYRILKYQYLNAKECNYDLNPDLVEKLSLVELMLTKDKPVLELADKDNFFEFDNTVNNDKEYLKENVSGNKDIKVLKYKSAPFIKMPVAQ